MKSKDLLKIAAAFALGYYLANQKNNTGLPGESPTTGTPAGPGIIPIYQGDTKGPGVGYASRWPIHWGQPKLSI